MRPRSGAIAIFDTYLCEIIQSSFALDAITKRLHQILPLIRTIYLCLIIMIFISFTTKYKYLKISLFFLYFFSWYHDFHSYLFKSLLNISTSKDRCFFFFSNFHRRVTFQMVNCICLIFPSYFFLEFSILTLMSELCLPNYLSSEALLAPNPSGFWHCHIPIVAYIPARKSACGWVKQNNVYIMYTRDNKKSKFTWQL